MGDATTTLTDAVPIMLEKIIKGFQFSRCHIGMKPRFWAMMMSFENTMASLLNVRSRCAAAVGLAPGY